MQNISEIDDLIKLISKLPGLGPKSAKRIILKMINNRQELMKPLAQTLNEVYKNVTRCKKCGTLKSSLSQCDNCENVSKNCGLIDLTGFHEREIITPLEASDPAWSPLLK